MHELRKNGIDLTKKSYDEAELGKLMRLAKHLQRLEKKNEELDNEKHIHFDLGTIGTADACGTTACVAGTAALLFLKPEDIRWEKDRGSSKRKYNGAMMSIAGFSAGNYDYFFAWLFKLPHEIADKMTNYSDFYENKGDEFATRVTAVEAGKKIEAWVKRQHQLHKAKV